MKRPHQITGALLLLLAAFVALEAMRLQFYTPLGPGPGFFPFWLAVILAALAAIMVFRATFGPMEPMPPDFFASRVGYLRIVAIAAALVGSAVLMHTLGFRLTLFAFVLFLLMALGRQNPIRAGLVAVVTSLGLFQAFTELLKIPLPIGVFAF